jgi:hydroxypyruvate isomerase
MPKVCVCVEMMYQDLSLAERARRVYDAGFDAVEIWFYDMGGDRKIGELSSFCRSVNMTINDMVANSPDGGIGGSLTDPADRPKYIARVKETIRVAKDVGCEKLITCTGNFRQGVSREEQRRSVVDSLKAACEVAESEGITLLLEPLNTLVDHKGYFVDSADEGAAICREVGSQSMKLLFDVYHMQIMQGNVIARIEQHMDVIGHFHAAGVPGRHELDSGELNYPEIMRRIDQLGYQGMFGLEYRPALAPDESLRQMRRLTQVSD